MSMANLFGFSAPVGIEISFHDEDTREHARVRAGKDVYESYPIYMDGETVDGKVTVRLKGGRNLEHNGIKVELIGSIELNNNRSKELDFVALSQALAAPGELRQTTSYDFTFKNVEKQYESYNGISVRLRYFIRATVARRVADSVQEKDLWVFSYRMPTDANSSIKMEVGIEDCLHIEFEYNRSRYHLQDVIVGKIYFLLVRIKIKTMELSIIRRETIGSASYAATNVHNESERITKFEIMDGAPVRGETIPIRLFLGSYSLTPTFRGKKASPEATLIDNKTWPEVNKRFSTRYYLNLVLIDEENRRYFKQQEITLYRNKSRLQL